MVESGPDACVAAISPCTRAHCRNPQPHGSHGATHCADLAEQKGITVDRPEPRPAEPEVKAEHSHSWDETGRWEKTCWPCDLVACRERGGDGQWSTRYRQTLRAQSRERLLAAGITPEDPGLARIASWNAGLDAVDPHAYPDHTPDREGSS